MSDVTRIREQIEAACLSEMDLSPEVARDVSFHMTDWLEDLRRYVAFCDNPDGYTPEQINHVLLGFLQHAPNHVAAAAKLYADLQVADVFGVGVLSVDGAADV